MAKGKDKTLTGAAGGAAAGAPLGPWGIAGGAVLGGILGSSVGNEEAPQAAQVDPAFLQSLQNQANGTEKTAADLKLKAAFDQSLAQQVAAARASRGVNPALLQRNVARNAVEQSAKAAQVGAELNLAAQEKARNQYLQALQLNAGIQNSNIQNQMKADSTNNAQFGSLINSAGGIGATFATANAASDQASKSPEMTIADSSPTAPAPQEQFVAPPEDSTQKAAAINNAYAQSDERSKTKIKAIAGKAAKAKNDLVVMSDERQKDLIKNESLPQNGNMTMQNQQAGAVPTQQSSAPQMSVAPQAPSVSQPVQPTTSPAPVPASQTALAQANASLAKGGKVSDLTMQDTSQLVKPADGPSQQEILEMSMDAQRRQTRDMFGNVKQSDKDNYAANLARWYAQNAQQKADYQKALDDAAAKNASTNQERQARLAKFYTGLSTTNANDLAQKYAPKVVTPATDWQSAQVAQTAAGIGDQSSGFNYANLGRQIALAGAGTAAAPLLSPAAQAYAGNRAVAQSDERSKTEVKSENATSAQGSMNPKDFLDKLTAYSYEYKQGQKNNPNAGPGKHLSVMAQDLEKAGPVGKSMVSEDENGIKQVDYGKSFGVMLAAQVQLNQRLAALEAKKNKK